MTVHMVLREAKELVMRAHYAPPAGIAWISVNDKYERTRPLEATRFTSIGAIQKVAAWQSTRTRRVWADNTNQGWEAFLLLGEAATQQGYGREPDDLAIVLDVDRAGLPAVVRMFDRALQLAPTSREKATA